MNKAAIYPILCDVCKDLVCYSDENGKYAIDAYHKIVCINCHDDDEGSICGGRVL